MTDLRQAATFALTTLHGWSNHDNWAWPRTALAQAKQNTAEAIPLLEAALAEPEPEGPTDKELWELYQGPGTFSPVEFARAVLARWGNHPGSPDSSTQPS